MTTSGYATANTSTIVDRIDPTDGTVLAQFTVPGYPRRLQSVGNQCWASVAPGGGDPDISRYADHFIRIGDSGVDYTSPGFDVGIDRGRSDGSVWETFVDFQGGVFWLARGDLGTMATLQRIDPATWQPSGPIWQTGAAGYQADRFAVINGSVWVFDNDGGIARLDVPLGP